jgi:2-methylisocitrate lyase-like PEP mutase family enzyme
MRLKQLLKAEMDGTRISEMPILLPCVYDGLTARLVARAGFDATFMTGFGVSGEFIKNELFDADFYRLTF